MAKAREEKEAKRHCGKKLVLGLVVLAVGLLYLMKDLELADWTMGVQPWTVIFVLAGLAFVWKGVKRMNK